MATRNEKETTRARANILREFLTNSDKDNRFDHEEIKEVFDLCLACKGCKSDCPSNVDVAKLKMEFLHQYYKENGVPIRSRLVGNFSTLSKIASYVPWAYNFIFDTPFLRRIANTVVGFHPDRTMPLLAKSTFKKWFKTNNQSAENNKVNTSKKVYLFVDEFTNYNDVEIGIKAVKLLNRLGYEVIVPNHVESGRPQLSKGLLDDAKRLANQNVSLLKDVISENIPLIGIEPSAILTFRDEYPDLVDENLLEDAKNLSKNVFMIEEFLSNEIEAKRISKSDFTTEKRLVKLHGHCQQKSLSRRREGCVKVGGPYLS